MEEMANQITRTIELANQVTTAVEESVQFRTQCLEIKTKTTVLAQLLLQTNLPNTNLYTYKRPAQLIIDNAEHALDKALTLVDTCRTRSLLRLIFTPSFSKITSQLDDSFHNLIWLLRVSGNRDDDIGYTNLPPIAANEPILCLIWDQIGNLQDQPKEAVASLFSLICDNHLYGKIVIEEGGVGPLLKLAEEGNGKAARAIGLLGRDKESVDQIVRAGVCSVFAKVLREGSMEAKRKVARAVHDHFSEDHAIRMIARSLALEIMVEQAECLKVTMVEPGERLKETMVEQGEFLQVNMVDQEEWVIDGEESLVQGTDSDSESYSD